MGVRGWWGAWFAVAAIVGLPWAVRGDGGDPEGRWTFEEGSGTTSADVTGNGHTATLGEDGAGSDLPAWTSEGGDAGLRFDGSDDDVGVSDGGAFGMGAGDSFTVEAVFRTEWTGKSRGEGLVNRRANFGMGVYSIYVSSQGYAVGEARDSNANYVTIVSTTVVGDGDLHRVTFIRDVAEDEFRLYVDGSREATASDTTTGSFNTGSLKFGKLTGNLSGDDEWHFQGDLFEAMVAKEVIEPSVPDTEPPSIEAPGDIVQECTGPSGQAVSLGTPEVSDAVDPDPVVTNDAPSVFHLGAATVTWTGTDDAGNSATDTQVVTVQDTTPPIITVPGPVTVECTGPSGQAVSLGTATAADVCDPDPAVANDAPALFGLGTTTVTWKAKDATGNESTGTQVVTVVDTTKPSLSVSGVPDESWPPDHRMVRIQPAVAVSDAADAAPTLVLTAVSNEPDDGLGDGDMAGDIVIRSPTDIELRAERSGKGNGRTYTLTWTAADDSGNAAVVTAVVTVPKSQGKK